MAAVALVLALALGGCGDDAAEGPGESPAAPTETATSGTTPVGGLGSATPTPTGAQAGAPAAVAAQSAAAELFDAIILPRGQRCAEANPEKRLCVGEVQNPEPERGIALVGVTTADEAGAFVAVMALDAKGGWGLWFTTQNVTFHRLVLPGEMRVCADGQRLNVREGPSVETALLTQFEPDTIVTVDGFQLARHARFTDRIDPDAFFDGWYHVTAPATGWVNANFVSDTQAADDCSVRDAAQADR
jgi:hypothetical protein